MLVLPGVLHGPLPFGRTQNYQFKSKANINIFFFDLLVIKTFLPSIKLSLCTLLHIFLKDFYSRNAILITTFQTLRFTRLSKRMDHTKRSLIRSLSHLNEDLQKLLFRWLFNISTPCFLKIFVATIMRTCNIFDYWSKSFSHLRFRRDISNQTQHSWQVINQSAQSLFTQILPITISGNNSGYAKAPSRFPHQLRSDASAHPHRQRSCHTRERENRAAHHEISARWTQSFRTGKIISLAPLSTHFYIKHSDHCWVIPE